MNTIITLEILRWTDNWSRRLTSFSVIFLDLVVGALAEVLGWTA